MRLQRRSHLSLPIVVFLLLGCGRQAPPPEEAHAAPVEAVGASTLRLGEWTELLGSTQPLPHRIARITAPLEGRVLSVLGDGKGPALEEGQQVKAGQIIAQLDDRIVRANREKVAAGVKELEQQKVQADNAVQLANIEVTRLERLQPNGSDPSKQLVSPIDIEKARIALKDAVSKQQGVVDKQEASKAELRTYDEQLNLHALRTPIAGRLGLIQVVPGQTLSVGGAVAAVVDLTEIDVLCFVPPATAARLALNQIARVVSEKDHEPGVEGKVIYLGVQAQADTGNVAVKLRFSNPDLKLRANSVIRVQVQTKPEEERLTIPDSALMEDEDPPTVVIVESLKEEQKDGKTEKLGTARKLKAKIGVRDRGWKRIEILGLEDPEKKQQVPLEDILVIKKGGHGLQTGDAVKLEEEEEESK